MAGVGARPAAEDEGLKAGATNSLAHRTAATIGSAIVKGDYKPGETLPVEAEICMALGVGRNILREAVKILAGKGLLKTTRRVGTMVLPRTSWTLLDPDILNWSVEESDNAIDLLEEIAEVRAAVLPEMAALAASRAGSSVRGALDEAVDRLERANGDGDAREAAARLFHRRLLEASGNEIAASLGRSFELLAVVPDDPVEGAKLYRALAAAIAKGHPGSARTAAKRLVEAETPIVEDA